MRRFRSTRTASLSIAHGRQPHRCQSGRARCDFFRTLALLGFAMRSRLRFSSPSSRVTFNSWQSSWHRHPDFSCSCAPTPPDTAWRPRRRVRSKLARGISQLRFAEKSLGAGRACVRRKNAPEAPKSAWGDVVGPHAATDKPPEACLSGLRSRDFGANVRWLSRAPGVRAACPR